MRHLSFLLLFTVLVTTLSISAKTVINVEFPGSGGRKAMLWTYADLVSFREKIAGETVAGRDGKFSFTIYNKDIIPVRIQVEFFRIDLYVEPDKEYVIKIAEVDMSKREFYPKTIVGYLRPQFTILKPEGKELNSELEKANEIFAGFYDTAYIYLYQSRLPKAVLDNFTAQVDSFRKATPSDFVKKHIDIQITQLRMLLRQTGTQAIVNEYFTGDKILYNDKIYMDFFNSFWSRYLLVSLRGLRYGQLDSVINNTGSYYALTRLIENDPLLKDPKVRELVILRNMLEMYNNRRFNKSSIQDILSDIAANGVSPENKKIAVNIRKMLMQYDNSKAPEFLLPGFDGEEYNLESFKGKYIYLSVWNEKCPDCLAEMDFEKELFMDFDDVIYFVSVYVGPDTAAAGKIIREREYEWTQLYYNEDFMFLKNYNVELFPYYILIDKNGHIEWYPANLPSENFSDYFIEMLNKKKGNLK